VGAKSFVAIPRELQEKAGFKRFKAIFVGYEEHRMGWHVRDLKGKYHFSHDVIFNEDLSGCLGVPRSIPFKAPPNVPDSLQSPQTAHAHTCTTGGHIYDNIIWLKEARQLERECRRILAVTGHGGAVVNVDVDTRVNGGENVAVIGGVDDHATANGVQTRL
jgi:hypothetical protein